MFLSKRDSEIAKGAAILLMLFHHLFAFPDRVPPGFAVHTILPGLPLESKLANFGNICIALFLFLSGYSHGIKAPSLHALPAQAGRRLLRFLSVYWANFAIFIPIGIYFYSGVVDWHTTIRRFDPSLSILIGNLTTMRITYNGEWWFARLYVLCIALLWPVLELLSRRGTRAVVTFSLVLLAASRVFQGFDDILYWQTCFTAGFLLARAPVLRPIPADLLCPGATSPLISLVSLSAAFTILLLIRARTFASADFLVAPLLIPVLIRLANTVRASSTLALFGRYSAHMWLNHTFFCYYFFPNLMYGLRYTPLIYATLVAVSLLTALVTGALANILSAGFTDRLLNLMTSRPPVAPAKQLATD